MRHQLGRARDVGEPCRDHLELALKGSSIRRCLFRRGDKISGPVPLQLELKLPAALPRERRSQRPTHPKNLLPVRSNRRIAGTYLRERRRTSRTCSMANHRVTYRPASSIRIIHQRASQVLTPGFSAAHAITDRADIMLTARSRDDHYPGASVISDLSSANWPFRTSHRAAYRGRSSGVTT